MARYIDAEKLVDKIDEWLDSVGYCTIGKHSSYYGELLGCIEDTQTADVEEVVRCKNCKFRYSTTCFAKHETSENDFCSCGAKMERQNK